MYHTQAIVLAPCSLCLVSYLNLAQNPSRAIVTVLYICVLLSLLFIIIKIPSFFSVPFAPGFAGLTFPMAIGVVASTKAAAYFLNGGQELMAAAAKQTAGFQVYLTSAIIGAVLLGFIKMLKR